MNKQEFRRRALAAHPDHGGSAEAFAELVRQRDQERPSHRGSQSAPIIVIRRRRRTRLVSLFRRRLRKLTRRNSITLSS